MEFGLNQYSQLSGIQNNTQAFFSSQDTLCESKEAYAKSKKKRKSPQAKFNSLYELENCLFTEEKKDEEDPTDKFVKAQVHRTADAVGNVATKAVGAGIAKLAVKDKKGLFAKWRTNRARRKYAKGIANKYGSSINQLAHAGADAIHEKYLK